MPATKSIIERLLDRLFSHYYLTVHEDRPYLKRWEIMHRASGRSIYLHKLLGDDWSRHPHDHPKDFISIGLKGSYIEECYEAVRPPLGKALRRKPDKVFQAPWIRRFDGEHIHRLKLMPGNGPCWTLVYTGPYDRPWGFYLPDGTFIPYTEYFRQEQEAA